MIIYKLGCIRNHYEIHVFLYMLKRKSWIYIYSYVTN